MRSVEAVVPDQTLSEPKTVSNWMESLSSLELRRVQTEDPDIGIVVNWPEHSYEPTTHELQLCGPLADKGRFKLKYGVLYYSWTNLDGRSDCLFVPTELRPRVIFFFHDSKDSGHLGQTETLDRLKQRFYWDGMPRDSGIYVNQ